jgi:hypothetical protein
MFESIKTKMLNAIEKDSIKVDVTGEKVYLKKSGIFKEWHVIYPPVDPETGNWNKTNLIFGSARSAVISLIAIIVVLGFAVLYVLFM